MALGVEALQEAQQLLEFHAREAARHAAFQYAHFRHQRVERLGATVGEMDALAAAIQRRAPACEHAGFFQPIEQCHDAGLVDAEVRAELDLRDAGVGPDQDQQAEQAGTDIPLADDGDVLPPGALVRAAQVEAQQPRQAAEIDPGVGGALSRRRQRPPAAGARPCWC